MFKIKYFIYLIISLIYIICSSISYADDVFEQHQQIYDNFQNNNEPMKNYQQYENYGQTINTIPNELKRNYQTTDELFENNHINMQTDADQWHNNSENFNNQYKNDLNNIDNNLLLYIQKMRNLNNNIINQKK